MRPIEQIRDPDQLKQIALLLQHENSYLHERLVALTRRIDEIEAASKQSSLILEIAKLQEQAATFQKKLFAESSKRRPRSGSGSDGSGDKAPPERRGHGPRERKELPIELVVHELAADQRGCPSCGKDLEAWAGQTEDGDEITVVERSFKLVRHQRQKYRCSCNGAVVTAPGPAKLIPGGRYSVEFAADVSIAKHLDHMPYERQCRVMAREGLVVDSHTLWDQVNALAAHLAVSYEALPARILASPVVHADETWWRVMGKSSKRWWVWCLTTKDAVFYRILESRSAQAARTVLGDYRGIVLADGYGAYESLSRAGPGFTLAHCWAHVRRKWVEAEPFYPDECAPVIAWISELYAIEAELRAAVSDVVIEPSALDRVRLARDVRSRPIVAKIHAWALAQRSTPQSSLRKAIEYMLGMWRGLTLFLDDPRIPLDNNPAERALRGPVLGRKNFYGSRSRRGTEVAALFYSLIETAKLCGVEPKRYLVAAAQAAIARPARSCSPKTSPDNRRKRRRLGRPHPFADPRGTARSYDAAASSARSRHRLRARSGGHASAAALEGRGVGGALGTASGAPPTDLVPVALGVADARVAGRRRGHIATSHSLPVRTEPLGRERCLEMMRLFEIRLMP